MFDIISKLFDRLKETQNGCLEFTGALDTSRYGIVWKDGANKGAHVLAYEHHNGPISEGMWVLHSCDNPPCCNIDHLFLGTRQDNVNDMIAKNRNYIQRGSEVHTSVLEESDVLEIYGLLDMGYSHRDIGSAYGMHHSSIGAIARGKNWAHLYREHRL